MEYREKFCVANDDHGYFPAGRDGKEGFDVRIRGVQWPGESGSLDGIYDTPMPDDTIPEFRLDATKYIHEMSKLGNRVFAVLLSDYKSKI